MEKTGIKVKIFNSEYNLQGDNIHEVEKVANHVDSLMQKIGYESPNQSGETIAVVSALNIAESYFKEKERNKEREKEYVSSIGECNTKISDIGNIIDENL